MSGTRMRTAVVTSTIALLTALGLAAWADSPATVRSFTLRTDMTQTGMAFFDGRDMDADAQNPVLEVSVGDTVQITLVDGDGALHDIVADEFNAASPAVRGKGKSVILTFIATRPGSFAYYCDIPGHREAGMEGKLEVRGTTAAPLALPPAAVVTTCGTFSPTKAGAEASGHADGGRAHRQRHVRHDPCRAGGGPARGGPRVLRHAGGDLHEGRLRRKGRAAA